jgi:hypothetical protein
VLRSQLAAAEQARAQYGEQLNNAVRVAEFAFLQQFPEFNGVTDANHLASIANSIRAQNPQRFAAIQNASAQAAQLLAAQQQQQQHAAARAQHEFQAYKAQQDDAFERSVGKISNADVEAVRDYLSDVLGLTPQEMQGLTRNPTAVDHRFQRALLDAGRYHALQRSAKAIPTRSVPNVQKPGVPSSKSRAQQSVEALERRLSVSGSEADGWALLQAKMRGRN